jgi:HSP20 family protein
MQTMATHRFGTRNPWDELVRMQNEVTRLMQSATGTSRAAAMPPLNVYDDGEGFHVRAEVAGLDRDKLDVSVAGDVLTIKGTRILEEPQGSYHRRERRWQQFDRSLTLPDTIDVDNVVANYSNGILEVALPRAAAVRPRKISIEAN